MYIVPQRIPAPRAAQTPRRECAAGAALEEATASKAAPAHITSAESPMETRFVGAPAAPSQAPAAKPQRMPSSWSFFERDASGTAEPIWVYTAGGILLRSENQRTNRSRSNPPIKTATGTQKWISLRTLAHQSRVFGSGSVAFIFHPK